MSLYPEMSNDPAPSAPPSYSEAMSGAYGNAPIGFCAPIPPAQTKEQVPLQPPVSVIVTPTILGPSSTRNICPYCHAQIMTTTKSQPGIIAYISGTLIALFGCWFGCCLIPCCIEDCRDIQHSCPECKAYLGTYKRV